MSDYYKILLSNRAEPEAEPSRAIEPEPSQRQEPRAEPIAKSHARAKPRGKRQGNITLYHYSQADFKDKIRVNYLHRARGLFIGGIL